MPHRINPVGTALRGAVNLPGDKSISHRYAILAALAEGRSKITNFSTGRDCASTLACLGRLGVEIEAKSGKIAIHGRGLHGLRHSIRAMNAENSATTMRLLAGVLAGQRFDSKITGDRSLRRRPMRRVVEPLERMGAKIRARQGEFAPLEIQGGPLHGLDYEMPLPSAQVKSAILLAGLLADGATCVREPAKTRDHTEIALREFGAAVHQKALTITVRGCSSLQPCDLSVPGDFSSAAFFIGAAIIVPGSELLLTNIGLNPSRTGLLDVLVSMGADLRISAVQMQSGELTGSIVVRHSLLKGGIVEGPAVAGLMDELPLLAALGPYTEQGIEIHDAAELRVKESDRIAALAKGLKEMGADVAEMPDGMRVAGRTAGPLRGGNVRASGDHRVAMALSIAALGSGGDTMLAGAESVSMSLPEFFPMIERLAAH